MKYTQEKITAIGKRLKYEAKKRGLSNQDVADLIGYSSGKQISPIYSGKKTLSEDQVSILCKAWGLRKEYLLCLDDWKTDSEVMENAKIEDVKNFAACRNYLETLGFVIRPYLMTRLPAMHIRRHWDFLKSFLTDETIQSILSDLDFSLTKQEFARKYYGMDINLKLKRAIDQIPVQDISEIGKTNGSWSDWYSVYCGDSKLKINTDYFVGCSVYYNGAYIKDCSIDSVQSFMLKVDAFVRCSIENLMLPPYCCRA